MSSIKISQLHPSGYTLFDDRESFIIELSDSEIETLQGGSFITQVTYSQGMIGDYVQPINQPNNEGIIGFEVLPTQEQSSTSNILDILI
jgi:hypothetical protein